MQATIVHLGHDNAPDPGALVADIIRAIEDRGAVIVASINGTSWSAGWGHEPGTWFVVHGEDPGLEARVLDAAAWHGQEAVAFTRGENAVVQTSREQAPA